MSKFTVVVSSFALALVALCAACAGSQVKKSARWEAYPGCNAAQCKSWYEECSAECINDREAGVTECENKCRASVSSCESQCGA